MKFLSFVNFVWTDIFGEAASSASSIPEMPWEGEEDWLHSSSTAATTISKVKLSEGTTLKASQGKKQNLT